MVCTSPSQSVSKNPYESLPMLDVARVRPMLILFHSDESNVCSMYILLFVVCDEPPAIRRHRMSGYTQASFVALLNVGIEIFTAGESTNVQSSVHCVSNDRDGPEHLLFEQIPFLCF